MKIAIVVELGQVVRVILSDKAEVMVVDKDVAVDEDLEGLNVFPGLKAFLIEETPEINPNLADQLFSAMRGEPCDGE